MTAFSHVQTESAYRDLLIDRACFLPVESTSAIESENVTGPAVRSALWFYTEEASAQLVAESGLKTRFFYGWFVILSLGHVDRVRRVAA